MVWLRSLFALEAGHNNWISGLRFALAFAVPVALCLVAGSPGTGIFVAIGAFFVANSDLGYQGRTAASSMVCAAIAVPSATALGMAMGQWHWPAVVVGFVLLFGSASLGAAGPTAAAVGVFTSFGYAIGLGLALTDISIPRVCALLIVGGVYAMVLSFAGRALGIPAFPPPPDLPQGHSARHSLMQQLRGWSPTVRRSLAIAIAGSVALTIVPRIQQTSGVWLVTGALIVLKPDVESTIRAAAARGIGTALGALAAGGLAAATGNAWILLVAAFFTTWWAQAIVTRSFGIFCILIAPLAVFMSNLVAPGDWQLAALRSLDVAIGSGIAVAVGALVLPGAVPSIESGGDVGQ